jgi:RND family efflux transporter MFP subunit
MITVAAMGTVVPAREMVLKSKVSGEVVKVHSEFTVGGVLKKGAEILRIDPRDYELAVTQKQSLVANADYNLKLELGHQEVAQREWTLLNGNKPAKSSDLELALRKPHLDKAKADFAAAKAELKQAKLNLSRTRIIAPFNAIVRSHNVEMGSQVSGQEALAELVYTDEYWIKVSIPVSRLKWISIPRNGNETGSVVNIVYRNGFERVGTVTKLLGDLETEGRMARILVSVKNPLSLDKPNKNQPPLLLGEYVRVEIEGHNLEAVYRIPRTSLRDNTYIWLAGDDGRLKIRKVDTLWRDDDTVFLKEGLNPGDRIIVSDLRTPVDGMPIREQGSQSATGVIEAETKRPEKGIVRRQISGTITG